MRVDAVTDTKQPTTPGQSEPGPATSDPAQSAADWIAECSLELCVLNGPFPRALLTDIRGMGARSQTAVYDGEELVGIRLDQVRADSLLDALGFCNGDILCSVAGRPVGVGEPPVKPLDKSLFKPIGENRSRRPFEIEIERNGRRITRRFEFR